MKKWTFATVIARGNFKFFTLHFSKIVFVFSVFFIFDFLTKSNAIVPYFIALKPEFRTFCAHAVVSRRGKLVFGPATNLGKNVSAVVVGLLL